MSRIFGPIDINPITDLIPYYGSWHYNKVASDEYRRILNSEKASENQKLFYAVKGNLNTMALMIYNVAFTFRLTKGIVDLIT
jgi:hypothetical protein